MACAVRFTNDINDAVTQSLLSGQQRLDRGIDFVSNRLAAGAVKVKESSIWLGRQVKHFVVDPVVAATIQCAKFSWAYKKTIAANVLAWALIIVFCGAIEGYSAVALPMFIGALPGFAVGAIGGMLSAKAFARDPEGTGTLHQFVEQYRKIPDWPKSVFLALFSSLCIVGCATVPYGMGAILGTIGGGFYGYHATCYDPNNPEERDQPDNLTLLHQKNRETERRVEDLELQLREIRTQQQNAALALTTPSQPPPSYPDDKQE